METVSAKKLNWLASVLLLTWMAGTVYAFWWFQAKDLRAFVSAAGDHPVVFSAEQLSGKLESLTQAKDPNRITVVHFWNPGCACNRFNNPHVQRIIKQYQASGVQFVTVAKSQPGRDERELLSEARDLFAVPAVLDRQLQLDSHSSPAATPAAAVINANGELAYYGPYSDSAFCGSNGTSFVEKALDTTLEGATQTPGNSLAFGCFCDWRSSPQTI